MRFSKELLTHVQWYFTREAQRYEDEIYDTDVRYYNTILKHLEEVRVALKEYESNTELPWYRVIYCRRSC